MKPLNTGNWLAQVHFNEQGLIPVIAQDMTSKEILMMAWMNQASLQETVELGQAVYWSRSRGRRWHKGEESGHFQNIKEILLDCDGDTILLIVEQVGGIACHTGAPNCFFQPLVKDSDELHWQNRFGEKK
ncbi:MAG: phosphoribosyl-AMP cyclohydrolase [Betaproteobacteria bacterium]